MAYDLLFNRPILALACKVAGFDENTEAYGTPVSSRALNTGEIEPEYDTDEAKIGGAIEHILAVMTGGNLKLTNVGYDVDWLKVVTNIVHSSSGSGTGTVRTITVNAGENNPYVGLIVQYLLDGGGDMHVGFARAKIQKALGVSVGESSEFAMSDIEAKFGRLRLADGTTIAAIKIENHATQTAITSDFDTFFGV